LKRRTIVNFSIVLTALVLLLASIGIVHYRDDSFPFRCTNFSRYDLTLKERERLVFTVTQDLRFQNHHSGYLLLNGKVTSGEVTTLLNRRINLITGDKIDYDTYRYRIGGIVKSSTDNTSDKAFNMLLAELTLGPFYLQLEVMKVDDKVYLIGGPLSDLFICRRY